MKIAITRGNNEINKKLIDFLRERFDFETINIDSIFERITYNNTQLESYDDFRDFFLKAERQINSIIRSEIKKNKKNVVICFSTMEDLEIFDDCDIKIKAPKKEDNLNNRYELYKSYRQSCIESNYSDSSYHLVLDHNENWKTRIENYINDLVQAETKVSIVVPIYNTEKYICKLVNSIINQTYRNLEIILIDDGSTDNSLKICQFLASKDERIKIVHQENVGLAETRNNGIELATGEYISFLDSDDYVDKTMIEELVKKAKETNADVCQCGFWIHTKDGFVKDVTNEQNGPEYFEGKKDLINAHSNHLISIAAWDKLYKLSSIKDIQFNKNVTKEDSDYIYRLCMKEKTFAIVNKPFYHYIKRPVTSLTGDKISTKLFMLQEWGHNAYNEVVNNGEEFQDAADKILFNSLVHILRYYMRDHKRGVLNNGEFQEEIQSVANDLMNLLLHAKNVKKFRKLDEVLEIINDLIDEKVLKKELMPSINIPCVGILWNSLNEEMMQEATTYIKQNALIKEQVQVDLGKKYRDFINEIYYDADEFLGIRAIKAGSLIDRYDTNNIVVLNLIIKVSNYIYNSKNEFVFEEIDELKTCIRNLFRSRIENYAYDNIFHLTIDENDYSHSNEVCKKYIREYKGVQNENK